MAIGALSTALQGLYAAQRQLEVISQNVANATTPGYTRKTLGQSSVVVGGKGEGVQVGEVVRAIDTALQNSLMGQNSIANASDIAESYLHRLQQLFGTPDSDQSFAGNLSKVKADLISLSADPSNNILQTQVVNDAQGLVANLNNISQNIQSLRSNTENQMSNSVTQANQLLQNIAQTNLQIKKLTASGNISTVELEDQRDQYIQDLSQFMNVATYSAGDGTVVVQTITGQVLADATAHTLAFSTSPMDYNTVYPTNANGVTLDGTDISSQITGGSMGGLLKTRDVDMPKAQAMLDEFSHKLALRFQAQGVKLFTDSSGNVPTDVVANYVGFSAKITVNSAVVADPSLLQNGTGGGTVASGDNTNIFKLIDYAFGQYQDGSNTAHTAFRISSLGPGGDLSIDMPTSSNIMDFANTVISRQAQQYTQSKNDLEFQQSYRDTLQKKLSDETGVSIDNEMTNMISIQKSYSSSARMITAVSQMFDELLRAVG